VVANAAMYSTSAVLAIGATPVFIDIAQDSTMDPGALRTAADTDALDAVVVTHLYGRLADMSAILDVANAFNIPVVEDCAQAHGARDRLGRAAGSLGAIGSFSFYPTKNLGALGDGGAVTTSDPVLADRVRQLRQYGWGQKYTNEVAGGRNSRLDELQAAMLRIMLPRLDGWNSRRREIANRYSTSIRHPDIAVPSPGGTEYVAHLYVLRTQRRQELREHLASLEIATEVHYPLSDHRQPCLEGKYAAESLERTERHSASVLSIPCFPELTDAEVDRVVDACNRF
ncbi:DegT/DnrJ/EryC1/StrS family aminotransferase, partial [Lysobacter sp. D1-1-M9]|uniref:DegT/DnrJ/EryC1/StrS family aminotransferase n=1 Tax=Novilysobacter longmucuonensis TaxID=3098603 RepID=UPI002FCAFA8B